MLHVTTLGELRERSDTGSARTLRRMPLALVVYLARGGMRPVSRTELATLFWGERGEDRARQSLRQALLEVKQALGDSVDIDAEIVRLVEGAVELDVAGFERDVSAGRLQEAAGRWTGDFFEGAEDVGGDGFRRWIENQRAGLHQQFGVAMGKLILDAEMRGDWPGAAGWAERWAAALPFDEPAHHRLIDAFRKNGRSGDALKTHAAFVSRVRAARDVEPSAEFLRLGAGLADDARSEVTRRGRGSAAVHAPQLVGRGAVVSELADAWTSLAAGPPLVVLVRGEAGSGLTRICDELAERAGTHGIVLRGRGDGATRDYATAAELFDGIRHSPGLAGAAPEALAEVARIVPSLAARFRHLPPALGDEAALRDGLVQTLGAVGEEHPVLLLVDDLHAADEASRRLLTALATRLVGRVMLLFTDDESEAPPGDLLGVRGLRRLQLGPLTLADVETMLGSMVTMEPGERHALAARLHQESGGLPHAVREVVNSLVDERRLQLDAGSWRVSPALAGMPLPVPPSVRERIRVRLDRLSTAARDVAEAMAVRGEPADATVVAAVVGLPPDVVESALTELVSRRFLREVPREPGRFAFSAPLVARAVAAILPPTRRQALQGRPAGEPEASAPNRTSQRRVRLALAAAAVAVLAVVIVVWGRGPAAGSTGPVPIIALGRISDYRENTSSDLTRPLTDMLATNLGRVHRLRVVSTARMYELMSQRDPEGRDSSAAALVAAARRAGATELVDGALYTRDDGGFRLDLRRVELRSGNIRQTHSVKGATVFELADSGTARLAGDFGEPTPLGSIADVTTRSITAYRLYEQGMRAYHANDLRAAEPLLEAALTEDSTFAMAAYYSALSSSGQPRVMRARLALAARLAAHTSDRERLTILAGQAFLASSPAQRALADTLVARYPEEVQGHFFTGLSRMVDGEFLAALPSLNRVVAMDSLALSGTRARCDACDALRQLVSAYQLADSLPAAEREARRWIRLQPRSPAAWFILAEVLSQRGRGEEAMAALDQAGAIDGGRRESERLIDRAVHRIYAGDFEQADRLLTGELESGAPYRQTLALWYRAISLRQQGRLDEGLADARRYRAVAMEKYPRGIVSARRAAPPEALAEAQILFEMQRYRAAAGLFDSVSRWVAGDESPSQLAHARVWAMTHAAGARAAAGDTAWLLARADTLEVLGQESALGRDHLLHHYVRGLVLAARGQDEAAIAAFRASVWSWSFGYTRANVALATSLLRLGRPREAVAALQSALHGSVEASNFYVPRTQLHELLGQAWGAVDGAAARDSAHAHFGAVARAWSRADTVFAARRERARLNSN